MWPCNFVKIMARKKTRVSPQGSDDHTFTRKKSDGRWSRYMQLPFCPQKVLDYRPVTVMIGKETYSLIIVDTTGEEDYDGLRLSSYPQTDVFLVCYSVVSPSSFENVKEKWQPEITHHCPDTPFLLVGTEIDLRDDPIVIERLHSNKMNPITLDQGQEMAKQLNAVKCVECSVRTKKGLKNVFDEAIWAALRSRELTKTGNCELL